MEIDTYVDTSRTLLPTRIIGSDWLDLLRLCKQSHVMYHFSGFQPASFSIYPPYPDFVSWS